MKPKDIMMLVVGILVLTGFFSVLWAVFNVEMPAANRDLALILLGVLASKFGDVVGYFYNTSKSSSDKTDIISKLPPLQVLILPILLFGLMSCGTSKTTIKEVPVQYKTKVIERIVPQIIPADSSAIFALFECDSTNQVVMRELNETKSKLSESKSQFSNGKLTYKLITKHDTVYVHAKDSIVYREVPIEVPVEKRINYVTDWQKSQMWAGRILIISIVVLVVYNLKFKS